MKLKFILLLATVSFLTNQSFGQIKFGAIAGLNISELRSNQPDFNKGLSSRTGLSLGITADYSISEKTSLQAVFNYSQMGGKYSETDLGTIYSSVSKLNYLAIPALVKVHFNDFAVFAGPQLSLLLSAKEDSFEDGILVGTSNSKSTLKGSEFSLLVGSEYSIINNISTGIRYQLGLSNMDKTGSIIKSNAFTLFLGYKF